MAFGKKSKAKPKRPPSCFAEFDIEYKDGVKVSAKRCTRPMGHGGTIFGPGHSNTRRN